MSKLVVVNCVWTVEDHLRFPTPKYGKVKWKKAENSSFYPIDKIRNKEFAFNTTDSFFRKETIPAEIIKCGFESGTLEIFHKKDGPNVYIRFLAKKATGSNDWGELKTLRFEVSLKSKYRGQVREVWEVIKAFDVTVPKPDSACQDLYRMAELCHIDVFEDYAIFHQTSRLCNRFRLELPIHVSVTVSRNTSSVTGVPIGLPVLNKNPMNLMKKLLCEALFTDFAIQVGQMTFPCHKSILAGQSDVFAAMFNSKMSEANSNQLEITDMSVAGAEAMLKYLYYKDVEGPVSNSTIALDLLKAGHKYQIKDLELESQSILSSMDAKKFDAKTAFDYFEFCGMVEGFQDGQGKAARVFKENAKKYNETGEFTAVLNDANLEVAAKLIEILASL